MFVHVTICVRAPLALYVQVVVVADVQVGECCVQPLSCVWVGLCVGVPTGVWMCQRALLRSWVCPA